MVLELLLIEPTKEKTEEENIKDLAEYVIFLNGLKKEIETQKCA